jgi:hypothetical protein
MDLYDQYCTAVGASTTVFPEAFKGCPLLFWHKTLKLSAGTRASP